VTLLLFGKNQEETEEWLEEINIARWSVSLCGCVLLIVTRQTRFNPIEDDDDTESIPKYCDGHTPQERSRAQDD
jgi:hypothetical protein